MLVTAFLFQHAVQGWCPPLPLIRHLGVRTAAEIDHERYALKLLRGDFSDGQTTNTGSDFADLARRLMLAVRA